MKPIIHPASEEMLLSITKKLPQSLLITGDNGVGLSTIGKYIATNNKVAPIIIQPEKDEKIDLNKGVISVDNIRYLYNETKTITNKKRIIIIDHAEHMTQQAQNAFLKLLEEPSKNTHFIIISHSVSKLLPTILSRVKRIDIRPITNEQSEQLLDSLNITDKTKRSQLLFIASGKPAELTNLCSDEKYFDQRSISVCNARDILRGNLYQKLLIIQKYKDDRVMALLLLTDVSNMLKFSIFNNPQVDTIKRIDSTLLAQRQIEANGNIRLCLTRMVL